MLGIIPTNWELSPKWRVWDLHLWIIILNLSYDLKSDRKN